MGDGWNANFVPADEFAAGVRLVRDRAPAGFGLSASVPFVFVGGGDVDAEVRARYGAAADTVRDAALAGSIGRITDDVGRFVEAGADWLILAVRPPFEFDALEAFAAEVAPHFA